LAVSLNEKLKNTTDHILPLTASARMAALGQMTANIAHELNNPLSVLRALSESISEHMGKTPGGASSELGLWTEKISTTVSRISRVISGLRTVSRDGSGDQLVVADPIEMVRETLEFSEQRLRYFGIKTRVDAGEGATRVRCRPVQVSQALLNLLNNSVDALASGHETADRWIRISVEERGDQVWICVTDSGHGISAGVANRIFRPFFTTKGLGAGTGLGLSISRQLVQANGGTLEHDPSSQHTRFAIRLPKA
jgi:C4-dicarboxylate-specific signal transduction histidine kinase